MSTAARSLSAPRHRATSRLLAAMAALPVLVSTVTAQTALSWSNAGSSTLGGAGTWDTVSSKWWDGASAVAWPTTGTSNTATFAGTAGTVTLGEAISANSLRFNITGYTLSGAQTLTLNGSTPTISVVSGGSAIIGNNTALVIAGSGGLTKTDAGTLTFSGTTANTFTGGLNVNGGTLALNFGNLSGSTPFNNLIASSNALSLSGGIVSIAGKGVSSSTSSQSFASTTVNSGISTVSLTNGTGATSVTANLGSVTVNTGGTLMLTAPSTTIKYNVSSGGNVALPASGNAFMRAGVMYGSGSSTRWAMVGSTGVVTTSVTSTALTTSDPGAGSAQLLSNISNVSTPIGGNFLSYGVVLNSTSAAGNVTIGNGASWTLNGVIGVGSLNATIGASGTGKVIIGDERDFVVNLASATSLTVGAPITNNGAGASNLTVSSSGAGILSLSGVNTYSGQTTINSGTTVIGTSGTINSTSGVVINGGTLRYNNTATALAPAITLNGGSLTGTGAITLGSVTVANNAGATLSNNNGAAGAALTLGNLTFNGAASLNLFSNSTSAPLVTAALATSSAGQVTINPVFSTGVWTSGTTYNLISFTGGAVGGAGVGQFVLGTVAGLNVARQSAALDNTSSAITLKITGDSPYWTGGSNGDWNTSQAGNWKLLSAGTDTTFIAGDQVQFTDAVGSGATSLNISTANVDVSAILFNNSTKDYAVGSTGGFGISGTGALTKNGSGLVTLNTGNSYSGGTTVNAGTLRAGSATAFGSATGASLAFGGGSTGTVQLNGNSMTVVGLATDAATPGTPTLENASATASTLTINTSAANTYVGVLRDGAGGGALSVVKGGTNALTLGGNNSYTGTTAIGGTSGGVVVTSNNALGSSAAGTTVATGTSLGFSGGVNYSTAEPIIGSGVGSSALGAFAATQRGFVQSISGNNTFAGPISINATGISRIGTQNGSQLTLSGPITMASGVTGVIVLFRVGDTNGDFVTLSNTGNSWDSDTQLFTANAGTGAGIRLGADNALPTAVSIVGASTTGSGTMLDMAGYNQSINGLADNGASLKISNSNAGQTSVLTLNTTANKSANTNTLIVDGSGKIQVIKSGAANQTLFGVNTYTGGTRIDGGTLTLGNANNTLADSGAVNVNGGTLALGGNVDTVGAVTLTSGSITGNSVVGQGILTGTGSDFDLRSGSVTAKLAGSVGLVKNSGGTVTLSGVNTFAGATTVNAGTLLVDTTGSLANTSGIAVASGATFVYNGSSALTKPITVTEGASISGTGTLTASGVSFSAGLGDGLSSVSLGSAFSKGGELSLTLTGIADGTYALFTGTSVGGSFTSVRVNGTLLAGSGVFTGMVNSLTYTYTDGLNQLVVSSIPEPSTFAVLAGFGVLGVAGLRRRRR